MPERERERESRMSVIKVKKESVRSYKMISSCCRRLMRLGVGKTRAGSDESFFAQQFCNKKKKDETRQWLVFNVGVGYCVSGIEFGILGFRPSPSEPFKLLPGRYPSQVSTMLSFGCFPLFRTLFYCMYTIT